MAARGELTPRAFIKAAAGKRFGGAYIVYGPDEYIKAETIRLAVCAHVPAGERAFSVSHLVAGQTDTAEILAATQAVPLLGNRTAVVVHDAARLAAPHKARLTDALAGVGPPALLLFAGPERLDRRTKFYKWFSDHGRSVGCEPLTEAQAEQFARRRLSAAEKTVAADALALLLEYSGPDAGVLAQESEKLALYVGTRRRIERADVVAVTGQSRGHDCDSLVDAQIGGDQARALQVARALLAAGADPATLIGRLIMHYFDLYRVLLSGQTDAWKVAGTLRLPRVRAERLCAWARRLAPAPVEEALAHLSDADHLIKSGRADAHLVFDALTLALAAGNFARPPASSP